MRWTGLTVVAASLQALACLAAGCAHAPAAGAPRTDGEATDRVVLTGSHVPQRIDPRSSLTASISPVRVYTAEQLAATGRRESLTAAIFQLVPALPDRAGPHR